MAALDGREVIEPREILVVFVIWPVVYEARSTGESQFGDNALAVGERLGRVDIGAVGLGAEAGGYGVDGALRIVEAGIVEQTRVDDVLEVNREASARGVGVGGCDVGDGGSGEETAWFSGRNNVVLKPAPNGELLVESVIDAGDFLDRKSVV